MQCTAVAGHPLLHPPTASSSLKDEELKLLLSLGSCLVSCGGQGRVGSAPHTAAAAPVGQPQDSPSHAWDRAGSKGTLFAESLLLQIPPRAEESPPDRLHYRDTRAGSSSSFSCFLWGLPPQPWGRVQRVGIWGGLKRERKMLKAWHSSCSHDL